MGSGEAALTYFGREGISNVSFTINGRLAALVECLNATDEEQRVEALHKALKIQEYLISETDSFSGMSHNFIGSAGALTHGADLVKQRWLSDHREFLLNRFPRRDVDQILNNEGEVFANPRLRLTPFDIASRERRTLIAHHLRTFNPDESDADLQPVVSEIACATEKCRETWDDLTPEERPYDSFEEFLLFQRKTLRKKTLMEMLREKRYQRYIDELPESLKSFLNNNTKFSHGFAEQLKELPDFKASKYDDKDARRAKRLLLEEYTSDLTNAISIANARYIAMGIEKFSDAILGRILGEDGRLQEALIQKVEEQKERQKSFLRGALKNMFCRVSPGFLKRRFCCPIPPAARLG